jgi:hypothetical protein
VRARTSPLRGPRRPRTSRTGPTRRDKARRRAASASAGRGCAVPGIWILLATMVGSRASWGRHLSNPLGDGPLGHVRRELCQRGRAVSGLDDPHISCPPLIQEPSGRPPRSGLSNPLQAAIAMRHSCGRCLWMRAKVSIYLGWHALPATGIGEILEAHPQSLRRHIQLGRKLRGSTPVRRGPTSGVRLRSRRSPAGRLV